MRQNNPDTKNQTQIPKTATSDGIDVEYSVELADQDDIKAQARANSADQRAKRKK
jgi:YfhD-like protein